MAAELLSALTVNPTLIHKMIKWASASSPAVPLTRLKGAIASAYGLPKFKTDDASRAIAMENSDGQTVLRVARAIWQILPQDEAAWSSPQWAQGLARLQNHLQADDFDPLAFTSPAVQPAQQPSSPDFLAVHLLLAIWSLDWDEAKVRQPLPSLEDEFYRLNWEFDEVHCDTGAMVGPVGQKHFIRCELKRPAWLKSDNDQIEFYCYVHDSSNRMTFSYARTVAGVLHHRGFLLEEANASDDEQALRAYGAEPGMGLQLLKCRLSHQKAAGGLGLVPALAFIDARGVVNSERFPEQMMAGVADPLIATSVRSVEPDRELPQGFHTSLHHGWYIPELDVHQGKPHQALRDGMASLKHNQYQSEMVRTCVIHDLPWYKFNHCVYAEPTSDQSTLVWPYR